MYEGDVRLMPVKVTLTRRIRLTWRFWHNGYMPLTVAIRTFLTSGE